MNTGAIRGANNKIHQSLVVSCKQCFNCFFRLLSYSLNCPFCPLRLSVESMKTRPSPSETAAAQISRRRAIHQPSFLRPSWSKEQNRAGKVHMYRCFIFLTWKAERPASPPAAWIKDVWGRIPHMQSTQRAGQVLLFIYNTLMRLFHWSTISSSLTLDRWHQREGEKEVILWLKALNIPSHSLCVLYINHKASSAAMLLQIFQPLRAKPQQWKCESLCMGCPLQYILPLIPELEEEYESPLPASDRLLMKDYEIIAAPWYLTLGTLLHFFVL